MEMGLDNPLHIAFLVVILLLVFGAKRLPEIGRSLGTGMREFKQSYHAASGDTAAAQRRSPRPRSSRQAPSHSPPPCSGAGRATAPRSTAPARPSRSRSTRL